MPQPDLVQVFSQTIEKQKSDALAQLKIWNQNPVILKHPVFFVPGWTDNADQGWTLPYTKSNTPMEEWGEKIFSNPELAYYLNFSKADSDACDSLLDFSKIFKPNDVQGERLTCKVSL